MRHMSNLILKAAMRAAAVNQAEKLRQVGKIPAVLYGHGFENRNIALDYLNFERVYQAGGSSSLVELMIEGENPIKVLIQDFQLDNRTNSFAHVDLRQVRMTEKIKTDIKLGFVGEAPAVKGLGGTFVKNFASVPVECLPQDLVAEIKVDISSLRNFGDVLHVKDVVAPPGVKILAHGEDVVATVIESKTEEEAAPAAEADLSQIKTEAEEKREKKTAEEGLEEEKEKEKTAKESKK